MQARDVGCDRRAGLALAMEACSTLVQPLAVVALLDLGVELVGGAQARARSGRRSGRGSRATPRRCWPTGAAAAGRPAPPARSARIGVGAIGRATRGSLPRRPAAPAALGERERQALDERAVRRAARRRRPRRRNSVSCGRRSSCAKASSSASRCVRRVGQAERNGDRSRQQRVGGPQRAEPAVVGARQDDGGERPQHRARERRDHDVGRQRLADSPSTGSGGRRSRARACRRPSA